MTTSDNWFESWFDSPLYEQLYASRDDAEAEMLVRWIAHMLPPSGYPVTVDMGCGRGRHSLLLAQEGYHVTGVDLSPKAIEKARKKAADHGVANLSFEIGDMRTWQCAPCDLMCNLFTSFGYFGDDTDNLRVIANMCGNLRHGGFLVMDYLNPQSVRKSLVPEETVTLGDVTCRISRVIENDTVIKSLSFVSSGDGRVMTYQERVKLYGADWFEKAFKERDMVMEKICGDYRGGAFAPETSPRMVMLARKIGGAGPQV